MGERCGTGSVEATPTGRASFQPIIARAAPDVTPSAVELAQSALPSQTASSDTERHTFNGGLTRPFLHRTLQLQWHRARKIVCDAGRGSCMVLLIPSPPAIPILLFPSTPLRPLRHANWSSDAVAAQLDATHGPNVDLGSSNSGGMALDMSSLAEDTPLANACCFSSLSVYLVFKHYRHAASSHHPQPEPHFTSPF